MAGAGAPFYMPLLWPVGNLFSAVSRPEKEIPPTPKATADLDFIGHLTSFAASCRSFALAYLCMYCATDDYPAFGRAKTWAWDWMWPILARNLLAAWTICGFWDWFLYFSPLKNKLHKFKLNPEYPSFNQLKHDAFYTTTAMFTAWAVEVIMCHLWASGTVAFQKDMWETPLVSLLWIITITHWRVPHFYLIHRGMHPWKTTAIPDIGKVLYRHVHALHHKSYNPTAFSGTNMHPVESTLYWTAALIPVVFGGHPLLFLGCIVDCAVGAWLGHDGFQFPGSGDYFHQLHHTHFDCNYGAMHVPMDKWFGSFASCKGDIKKIWGRANEEDRTAEGKTQ